MGPGGRLDGKVALVTGAGRGIGRTIALRLAAEGAALIVNYANSSQGAEEVVERVRSQGGRALAIGADISQRNEVRRLFEQVDREFGRLDIVVNSAGISERTPLATLDDEVVEKLLSVNRSYPGERRRQHLTGGPGVVNPAAGRARTDRLRPAPGAAARRARE